MDHGKKVFENVKTQFAFVYVGRYGGAGIVSPHSFINDGWLDFIIHPKVLSISQSAALKDLAFKHGGTQVYKETCEQYRVKHAKVTNKDKEKDGSMKTCNYNIDGECLTFDNYMTY